jgi:hypothetical protein
LDKEQQRRVARVLAELADWGYLPIYLKETADRYPRRRMDWIEGLAFFLEGYAFERQGRSPDYARQAGQAFTEVASAQGNVVTPSSHLSQQCWNRFCELGRYLPDGKGANPNVNPLNPKESHDVITICDRLKKHGYNIYSFARGAIEGDTIREAHQTIDEIRGLGKKNSVLFSPRCCSRLRY